MKKVLIWFLIAVMGLYGGMAMAAGSSVSVTVTEYPGRLDVLTFTWTADDSDGSVPATASTGFFPNPDRASEVGCVYAVVVDPGACATCPTDNYDITINETLTGVDIMGGELANLSNTVTSQDSAKIGNAFACRPIYDAITLTLTNNSVNSATGVVYVYIWY
jgi:hypothetical protein